MIRWLTPEIVCFIHDELIAEHGGEPGLRDRGLLDSALARPKHLEAYEEVALHKLAASYAYGIARNHPFLDGNKRTALMALYVFLKLNGANLIASEESAYTIMVGLARGDVDENALSEWVRTHIE
jgi:death on curing protein